MPQEGTRVNHERETWTVIEINMITAQIKLSNGDGRVITLPASRFEKADNFWKVKAYEIPHKK
jgi:hypothetical protein